MDGEELTLEELQELDQAEAICHMVHMYRYALISSCIFTEQNSSMDDPLGLQVLFQAPVGPFSSL